MLVSAAPAELLETSDELGSMEVKTVPVEVKVAARDSTLLVSSRLKISETCVEVPVSMPVDVSIGPIVLLVASDKVGSIEPIVGTIEPILLENGRLTLSDIISDTCVELMNSGPVDVGTNTRELLGPSNRLDSIELVVETIDPRPLVISSVDWISKVLVVALPDITLLNDKLDSTETDVPTNVCVSKLDSILLEDSND